MNKEDNTLLDYTYAYVLFFFTVISTHLKSSTTTVSSPNFSTIDLNILITSFSVPNKFKVCITQAITLNEEKSNNH